jgi:SAM-dependent methyltransferase
VVTTRALDGRQPESAAGHDVATTVKDFYERYPYPRPTDDLDNYRRRWQDPNRRRADFHLLWPEEPYKEERTILVAGCGTSQAAKHAARCPAARVIGIDFSATSVRHTEDLRRKYDLTNLEVHQLPIDRIGDLEMTFDEIVCTGVLHHLANPEAALRGLRDVLDPDGAIHLMVYAPYGRAGIYMLQEFCRGIGIQALTSPEMTGEWEFKLKQMEHGGMPRPEFMQGIRHFTEEIVAKAINDHRVIVTNERLCFVYLFLHDVGPQRSFQRGLCSYGLSRKSVHRGIRCAVLIKERSACRAQVNEPRSVY